MRLAIVGSRTFTDSLLMMENLDRLNFVNTIEAFVSGGAGGADSLARSVAKRFFAGKPFIEHLPDFERYGSPAALFVRNQKIVDDADELIAFFGPDGPTKGTDHAIRLARAKRIPIHIYWQRT